MESLDGKQVAIEKYIAKGIGAKKAGVYAILDQDGVYQYIGYARNVLSAIKVSRPVA